ncbi:MAG: hypothetical protein JWP89_2810 [Schlesneria sp.]|nr:hypothetical protein [Schlesneria sp.]
MPTGKSTRSEAESPGGTWAIRLPSTSLDIDDQTQDALGHLRLVSAVEVLIEADVIWLRGSELDEQTSNLLRSLPEAERYLVLSGDQLARWGETIPRANLPVGTWQPITNWLAVSLPTAAFAPRVDASIPFKLVRSSVPAEANLLRTTWTAWRDYATTAAQIRLNQLSFAASESEALVRGVPVPAIPGQRFVESAGVAIPAGWKSDPELDAKSIRSVLKVAEGTITLFCEDGSFESIPDQAFVRATRSAVRMTDHASHENSNAEP